MVRSLGCRYTSRDDEGGDGWICFSGDSFSSSVIFFPSRSHVGKLKSFLLSVSFMSSVSVICIIR